MEEVATPPCRVCGQTQEVICYQEDKPGETVCPECCQKAEHSDGETGHQFDYKRDERGHTCRYCGINRDCTDYRE